DLRLQDRRHLPRRGRPAPDPPGRTRDARADGTAPRVRRFSAAQGGAHRRLPAHDGADRRPHRDPHRARRRGALGLLQHLLHPGRGGGRRRRGRRHSERAGRRARVRLEERVPRGILVDRGPDPHLARFGRGPRPEHDPRRRRRRHHARAQGRRVRGRRGRPGEPGRKRCRLLPRVHRVPRRAAQHHRHRAREVDRDCRRYQGRHRRDHDRRAPPVPAGGTGQAVVPGDQRQRLGDQVEVRQQVRHPAFTARRPQPRHRRSHR
ncbi:MAG: Adenosylhomocysteinase, partial [uncultured Arthrobacter sp.]